MAPDRRWNTLIDTREWLETLRSSIDDHITRGDSINVWGLPSTGTSSQLRKLINETNNDTFFPLVDTQWLSSITMESFFELLTSQLRELSPTKLEDENGGQSRLIETQKLLKEITQEKKVCIIVDSMDDLTGLERNFYSSLKALRDKFFGRLSFIFVSNRPLYDNENFSKYEDFVDFACHREIIAKPLDDRAAVEEVRKTLEYFKISVLESEIPEIVTLTGGSLGLLKSLLRVVEQDPDLTFKPKEILKNHSIRNRINRVCEIMTEEERKYLEMLAKGKQPKTKSTPFIKKSGVIENNSIKGDLLKEALLQGCPSNNGTDGPYRQLSVEDPGNSAGAESSSGYSFDYVSGEIFKNGRRLDEVLSQKETKIIRALMKNPGKLVTREEVGEAMWGNTAEKEYSEWAIDKTISRIRKKIDDSKRPYRHLVTIKGRGFKFYPQNK